MNEIVFKGITTIYPRLLSITSKNIAKIKMHNHPILEIDINDEQFTILGDFLQKRVKLEGQAAWNKDYQIINFELIEIHEYWKDVPFPEAMKKLSKVLAPHWENCDVAKEIEKFRYDEDKKPFSSN